MRKMWKVAMAVVALVSLWLSCLIFVHAALSYRHTPEKNPFFQGDHGWSGYIGDANHIFQERDGAFILYDARVSKPLCRLNLWLVGAIAALPAALWVGRTVRNRVRSRQPAFPVEEPQGPESRHP
jgi:hypothetical protein